MGKREEDEEEEGGRQTRRVEKKGREEGENYTHSGDL